MWFFIESEMFPKPGCSKAVQKELGLEAVQEGSRGHTVPWDGWEQRALGNTQVLGSSVEGQKVQEVEERPINETLRYHIYFTSTQFYQVPTLSPSCLLGWKEQHHKTLDQKNRHPHSHHLLCACWVPGTVLNTT